jgi:hypothetical protein
MTAAGSTMPATSINLPAIMFDMSKLVRKSANSTRKSGE